MSLDAILGNAKLGSLVLGDGAEINVFTVDASVSISASLVASDGTSIEHVSATVTPTFTLVALPNPQIVIHCSVAAPMSGAASEYMAWAESASVTITPVATPQAARIRDVDAEQSVSYAATVALSDPTFVFAIVVLDEMNLDAIDGQQFIDSDDGETNPVDITLAASEVCQITLNETLPLITYDTEYTDEGLVTTETGINLTAIAGQISSASASVAATPNILANGYVTKTSAIPAFCVVSTGFNVSAAGAQNADSEIFIYPALEADAVVADSNCDVTLDANAVAECGIVTGVSGTLSVTYELAINAIDANGPCVLEEYNPFNGAGPLTMPDTDLPDDSGETGFKLEYPTTTPSDILTLPNPGYNNVQRISVQRINRETRGGKLIIYRDPAWLQYETLAVTIPGMSQTQAFALRDFMRNHIGQEIRLIDYEGRAWNGIITDPNQPIVQDSRGTCHSFTGSFEFQGERV